MKTEDIARLLWEYVTIESLKKKDIKIREFTMDFGVWLKDMRVLSGKPLYSLSPDALLRQVRKAITFLIQEKQAVKPKRGWVKFKDKSFYNGRLVSVE